MGVVMTEDKPKIWTTKELAEYAQVDQSYIRRLLIDEKLKGYKFGRDWVIPDDEAQRWLEGRKTDDK